MDLKLKKPCKTCPFLKGTHFVNSLPVERIEEIADVLMKHGTFSCHTTNHTLLDEEGEEVTDEEGYEIICEPHHCAGAAILLWKEGNPNLLMRIEAMKNKEYRPEFYSKKSQDKCFDSFEQMLEYWEEHNQE